MNKQANRTTVVYAEVDGVKSTPATRVSQAAFDYACELSDQTWDAVMAQVPPHVAALLNAHDELTTTLVQIEHKMKDDSAPRFGALSAADLREVSRLSGVVACLLAA